MANTANEMTARMMAVLNGMMLDMLAAIARKDYTDRHRRQQQGIEKAKAQGGYKGRKENTERNAAIVSMLARGDRWNTIIAATGCSRSSLSGLNQRMKAAQTGSGNKIHIN